MLKIPLHPARQLEICEALCCSSTRQQLCSTVHTVCRLASCPLRGTPYNPWEQTSADRGRVLTCSTTFVSWGTMVMIREPRSTLRRVSLLGAAALLRPAWRAEDSIFINTHGKPQHSAPVRLSYVALQGILDWLSQQYTSDLQPFQTGRGPLSAKHCCTPSRDMSSTHQDPKAQQTRREGHWKM